MSEFWILEKSLFEKFETFVVEIRKKNFEDAAVGSQKLFFFICEKIFPIFDKNWHDGQWRKVKVSDAISVSDETYAYLSIQRRHSGWMKEFNGSNADVATNPDNHHLSEDEATGYSESKATKETEEAKSLKRNYWDLSELKTFYQVSRIFCSETNCVHIFLPINFQQTQTELGRLRKLQVGQSWDGGFMKHHHEEFERKTAEEEKTDNVFVGESVSHDQNAIDVICSSIDISFDTSPHVDNRNSSYEEV